MNNKFHDLTPEQFIRQVLYMYLNEKKSPAQIANYFDLSLAVINRVITQYEKKSVTQKQITDKRKNDIKELKDTARKETEKITEEDIKDMLDIDLKLFEKGQEP